MFARSLRAPLRVLLRQRSVREGALRRARNPAQNPVYLNPVYLLRLSRVLRLRALGLLRQQALGLLRLLALGLVRLLRVRLAHRFLPRQFLLCARLLAYPPPLT